MNGGERFDVFLSYHWQDHARVEALAQGLRREGLQVFLDRWYLTPGRPWPQRLEEILGQCGAVAVCVGKGEMGPWQQREAYQALARQAKDPGFPVIPVLLPEAEPPLGFLGQNTWVDYRAGDDPTLPALLAAAVRGEPPGPELQARVSQTLATLCPYRGLLYFREEDAPFFCGREETIGQLGEAVARQSLVAVVGASGCGKSSLVRAGLLPALRQSRETTWEMATVVPGDRPLHALAGGFLPLLEPAMTETDRLIEAGKLVQALQEGTVGLREVADRVLAKQPGSQRLLLVVDQWEELFTLTADETTRRVFLDNILAATETGNLTVVLTLRGDFFGRAITSYRPLSDRVQGAQINLGPMNKEELRRAVVEPAKKVGLSFESGLVERILGDTGEEPGNLPLLEFVLRRLWEERRGRELHHEAYEAMGGLPGAIASRAEEIYGKLAATEQQEVHQIFLRLVRPGEGQADTRRRASLKECGEPCRGLISRLANERLLVTSQGAEAGPETVEVAHEALIQHWQRLQGWVNEDRRFLTWQQHLSADATEWQERGRLPELLLRGLPLTEARQWLQQRRESLSPQERTFIEKSRRRTSIRRGLAGAVTALVFVVVLGLWFHAAREGSRAQAARERAEELVNFLLFDLRDRLAPIGRLDLMAEVNRRVEEYYQAMGSSSREQERRRGVHFNNQGDMLLAEGKLPEARKAYESSLAIAERLAKQDPGNAEWQRDLSVSYNKVGDVLVAEGKLPEARTAYESSLAIRERLAKQDPGNAQWQRDLSVSYNKVGDVLVAEGKLPEARKAYESSLAIAERLAKQDPGNAEWQRDLSVSYNKVGDVLVAEGSCRRRRKAYESSLAIAERLAKQDPGNAQWQRDLSSATIRWGTC